MSDLTHVAREAWDAALGGNSSVSISEVRDSVKQAFSDLVEAEKDRLFDIALDRILKGFARDQALSSTYQSSLFGFPAVIAVPIADAEPSALPEEEEPDQYRYMEVKKARWGELVKGRTIREVNVRRAVEKLDAYNASLDAVEPHMKDTGLTLEEAMRRFS